MALNFLFLIHFFVGDGREGVSFLCNILVNHLLPETRLKSV